MVEEKGVRLSDILFKAVELNKPNLLSKLLKDGYNVNTIEEESGSALLHVAAANGNVFYRKFKIKSYINLFYKFPGSK